MSKRINAKHKVDRRLGVNLWGRPKSPFNKRAYGPGQHGQRASAKPSDYKIQLQAKQKLKNYYGNLNRLGAMNNYIQELDLLKKKKFFVGFYLKPDFLFLKLKRNQYQLFYSQEF